MIEKPNVRFHDGQILSEEPLNKAMVAVDDCVDAANDAATKAETAETAATSAQSSASSAAESSAAIQRALEEIKGSGDIPAATVTKVAEHTVELATLGSKTSEISKEEIEETNDEGIDIEDNNGNNVFHLDVNGLNAKNIKSNGVDVATEEDVEKVKIPEISHDTTYESDSAVIIATDDGRKVLDMHTEIVDDTEECQAWASDDFDGKGHGEKYAKVTPKGVSAKGFFDMNGNPITSSMPCKVVDINGKGDFISIQEAIDNTNDGETLFIMPGVYDGHVNMYNKPRHLVGISKESVLITTHSGLRADNPMNANVGSIENVSIIAYIDNESPEEYWARPYLDRSAYAIHIDTRYTSEARHELLISNCILISYAHAAIGIGVRFNQTIKIENCELITYNIESRGAIYVHNDDFYPNSSGAVVIVDKCYLQGVTGKAVEVNSLQNNALCELIFINNTCVCISGDGTKTITNIVTPKTESNVWKHDISNSILSNGNNINELNYN